MHFVKCCQFVRFTSTRQRFPSRFIVRNRPFNLKGGGVWFFVSFRIVFRTTQVRIFFFLSRKARNFFPELNIKLYDKNSESDYFFFLHQNQNIFFSNIGNQNIFLEKKPYPPSPLQVKWSFPNPLLTEKYF